MTASAAAGAVRVWDLRTDRKAYIVWIACVWAAILLGFGLDFVRYLGESPAPPLVLHVHGAVYALWLILVTIQIALVEGGKVQLHKQLGWWTAGVSAVLVPLGVIAALVDKARLFGRSDADLPFLGEEFLDMVGFSVLMTLGLLRRKDLPAHKRLMILSAIALSDAGFGRIWQAGFRIPATGPLTWWLSYYWGIPLLLVAMAGWDLWRRRTIHWTVPFGAAVLLTDQALATTLYYSPAWGRVMTSLMHVWTWKG